MPLTEVTAVVDDKTTIVVEVRTKGVEDHSRMTEGERWDRFCAKVREAIQDVMTDDGGYGHGV